MTDPELVLIVLACRDLARMRDFYRAVLGWDVIADEPVYVELRSRAMRLGLYRDDAFGRNIGGTPAPSPPITRTEIYLHCADLDGAIARAIAAGATSLSPRAPRAWGDDAAYVADPEGNVLVLARPVSDPVGDRRGG